MLWTKKRLVAQPLFVVTNVEWQLAVCVQYLFHPRERRLVTETEGPEALASVLDSSAQSWMTAKKVNGYCTSSTSAGSPPISENSQANVGYAPNSRPTVPCDRFLKSVRTNFPTAERYESEGNSKKIRLMSSECYISSISSTACR